MKVEGFLDLLEGVKRTGPGRWLARCPGHPDRNPSLSIAEGDDGRVLLKCFAGCGVEEITGGVGLNPSDLFPPSLIENRSLPKNRTNGRPSAADCLQMLDESVFVIELCARIISDGGTLTPKQSREFERSTNHVAAIRRGWMERR